MAAVVLAVAMLAACGGDGESATTTTAPAVETMATEAPTTTGATATTDLFDYAQQYLDLVAPANCANQALGEVIRRLDQTTATYQEAKAAGLFDAAGETAAAWVTFYEGLVAADWPEDVQPAIDDLVAETSADARKIESIANAVDDASFYAAMNQSIGEENNAGVVRARLGLPSNIGDEPDAC
jgi:hypothetical protein